MSSSRLGERKGESTAPTVDDSLARSGEESEDNESLNGLQAFGSSVNLGGGGGVIITQSEPHPRTVRERALANARLCGRGAVAGAGMFAESYFLFALGNITPIWAQAYPSCFPQPPSFNYSAYPSCSEGLVASLSYIEVVGVIIGMLSFGVAADKLGRRWGSCSTATIMFVGGALTAGAYGGPDNWTGLFVMFAVCLFFFSYGVGGEYPLASASAAERAEAARRAGLAANPSHGVLHVRGKSVVMVFAMQGWGNWVNTLLIMLMLLGQSCTGTTCSLGSLELVWRLQYAIGALFLLVLMAGRLLLLKESEMWKANRERLRAAAEEEGGAQTKVKRLAARYYWHRMIGTGLGWLVWGKFSRC
jgi:MFS family permease